MGDKELTNALAQMVDANRKRDEQMEEDQRRRDLRMEELAEATRIRDEQLAKILQAMVPAAGGAAVSRPTVVSGALPSFPEFDSNAEIWTEYWARFTTFLAAQSVPEEKKAHVFLTNQSTLVYRMLTNLAAQQATPKEINALSIDEITEFMKEQYDPKKFVVRERYKFWSKMDRKPGETVPELAARLRADAAICDFASIKDPQDEALRTRFFCSVNNEAVLKAFFWVKDDELTFARAVEIAQELEDVSAVAKETIYGKKPLPVFQVDYEDEPANVNRVGRRPTSLPQQPGPRKQFSCDRCGQTNHHRDNCRMMDATCFNCQRKGHIASMCRAQHRGSSPKSPPIRSQHNAVHRISTVKEVGESASWAGQIRRVSSSEESAASADERVKPVFRVGRIRQVLSSQEGAPPTTDADKRTPNVTCYRCRKKGHIASRCRRRGQGGSPPKSPPINGQHRVRSTSLVIDEIVAAEKSAMNPALSLPTPTHRRSPDAARYPRRALRLSSSVVAVQKSAQPDGGGASQERRPSGTVSDWKENRQPHDSLPHGKRYSPPRRVRSAMEKPNEKLRSEQPAMETPREERQVPLRRKRSAMEQPQEERPEQLKSVRPVMETPSTHMENLVAKEQKKLTPAGEMTPTPTEEEVDEGTENLASRVVPGSTPVGNDERQEVPSEVLLVVHRSSTSECDKESHRREAKRRKKGRNRTRRRMKQKEVLQKEKTAISTCDDRVDQDFVGEESRDAAETSDYQPPIDVAMDAVQPPQSSDAEMSPATVMSPIPLADVQAGGRSSNSRSSSGESRSSTAAADDVDPRRRGEHAAAVSERCGVVGSAIATGYRQYDREETADVGKQSVSQDDGDRSSSTQMPERQQRQGTDDGDDDYKGKSTFPSVQRAVRLPPERISSVSTFRVVHRDEDVHPSDDVADRSPSPSSKTCSASVPPREVPPQTGDVVEPQRHHQDRRNWWWFDDDAVLLGPSREQRRHEQSTAEPPDITPLFG